MGHSNIYIRKENEAAWNGIEDKSAWVNNLLRVKPQRPLVQADIKELGDGLAEAYQKSAIQKTAIRSSRIYEPSGEMVKTASHFKLCKHGADPKFCKFAKNGKACK